MMHLNQNSTVRITLAVLLLLVLALHFAGNVNAQSASSFSRTVTVTAPNTVMHVDVVQNFFVPFEVLLDDDQVVDAVENANVTVDVITGHGDVMDNLVPTTNTTGYATFNYSCPVPVILTFMPVHAVTQDGAEWNVSLSNFQYINGTVYVDTFDAELVRVNTETLGHTDVAVNVTYLLVPEEGLELRQIYNLHNIEVVSKIIHGANVTINGVKAEETAVQGVYTASFDTRLPTAFVLVEMVQEGWVSAHEGFSFVHTANSVIWTPAIIVGIACAAVALALYFVLLEKSKRAIGFRGTVCPFLGGALLVVSAFVSLYWGAVGLDGALSGFDWMLLGVAGVGSFVFGLAGSVMAMKRKSQPSVILAVCAPLIANEFFVKAMLDGYALATPWVILLLSLVTAVVSGILVSNVDGQAA